MITRKRAQAEIVALIPRWLPRAADGKVPCAEDPKWWHTQPIETQSAICRTCPFQAECLATGQAITPAGEVWGGLLIGTPDREHQQVVA